MPNKQIGTLKTSDEFSEGISRYYIDNEVISFLQSHKFLNGIYQQMMQAEGLAVVYPTLIPLDKDSCDFDLMIIIKQETQTATGQWEIFLAEDFVRNATNLQSLFDYISATTNTDIQPIIHSIQQQLKEDENIEQPEIELLQFENEDQKITCFQIAESNEEKQQSVETENVFIGKNETKGKLADYEKDINEYINKKLFFNALFICGTTGIGKTYIMNKVLKENHMIEYKEDRGMKFNSNEYDYISLSGSIGRRKTGRKNLQKLLYNHRDKLIIFDNLDDMWWDDDMFDLIMIAAKCPDYSPGTMIFWGDDKIRNEDGSLVPNQFRFNGKIIFISNLTRKENSKIAKFVSSGYCHYIDFSN